MSVNKVILVGNVGREPQVRYFDKGSAVASFPLATTERGYTMQNGTEVPDRTEWHNVVFWGKTAEMIERYVHKGDKIYVEGKLRTRSYDDASGIHRTVTEVYGDSLELMPRPQQNEKAPSATLPSSTTADDLP